MSESIILAEVIFNKFFEYEMGCFLEGFLLVDNSRSSLSCTVFLWYSEREEKKKNRRYF